MAKSAKGGTFERYISKYFSAWITGDPKTEPLIWRSAGSGACYTVNSRRGKAQKNMAGDLIAIDERANFLMNFFSIECKNGYKSANIFTTFKETKSDVLRGFWEQTINDSIKSEKNPMLVFKPLGNKPLVGFKKEFVDKYFSMLYEQLEQSISIKFNKTLPTLILFELEKVFQIITPDILKECIK